MGTSDVETEIDSSDGTRRSKGCRGSWWDRVHQCELRDGVDFVEDSEDGSGDDFVFIPDFDEESSREYINSEADDVEYVLETEPQDLVQEAPTGVIQVAASPGVVQAAASPGIVQAAASPEVASPAVVQAASGVDSDAKANAKLIRNLTSADEDYEDFIFQWMLHIYPERFHPLLKDMKGKSYK